ncbi:hypothetical protein ACTFIY_007056 [Dictyostelium cf. discoideum]
MKIVRVVAILLFNLSILGAGFIQAALLGNTDGSGSICDHSAGFKYYRSDTRFAYGKLGAGGVVCVKTSTGIIVAVYDDKLQPGAAANIAEKLADYLIQNNC